MEKVMENAVNENMAAFFALIKHPLKFRLYLIRNVPAAYFSGVRIIAAAANECQVSVPYKWLNRNPFRSTYFASLSMAAELSTGVLVMAHTYKRKPSVAMLVTAIEGKFHKKATGTSYFKCADGEKIEQAIFKAISLEVPQEVKAHSTGKDKDGNLLAEFWITWSFKKR